MIRTPRLNAKDVATQTESGYNRMIEIDGRTPSFLARGRQGNAGSATSIAG